MVAPNLSRRRAMNAHLIFALGCALALGGCGKSKEERELEAAEQGVQDAVANVQAAGEQMGQGGTPAMVEPPASLAVITPEYVRASALAICRAKYPTDFAMQGGCKRNIERGAASVTEIAARFSAVPEMQSSLAECVRRYTGDGATDFAMAGGCARNNEQGFAEMAR